MSVDKVILYIASSGRSGSTLIDMLLGGHRRISSTGEFQNLSHFAASNEDCTCGQKVVECPFWNQVVQIGYRKLGGSVEYEELLKKMDPMLRMEDIGQVRDFAQKLLMVAGIRPPWWFSSIVVGSAHCKAIDNSYFWLDNIMEVDKSAIAIDSSKDVRRLKLYYLSNPRSLRVLHLVRDGRAVSASAIRRLGCSMTDAAEEWRQKNVKILAALRGMPKCNILFVRYEDFCAEPEQSLQRICSFLGIDFDYRMMMLNKSKRHNIGGNPMRFRRDETTVKLDVQWKSQITESQLAEFDRVAGKLNRKLGYMP